MSEKKPPFTIHIDNKLIKVDQLRMTGAELKALAGLDATYQLFLEEKGDAPDRQISDDDTVEMENGLHFFASQPATFGLTVNAIEAQLAALRASYARVEMNVGAGGKHWVLIGDVTLPTGWNQRSTTLVIEIPVGYPMAAPDCFWADGSLRLASGAMPQNAALNANYGGGEPRVWFSYHPQGWNPNIDDLARYVNVARKRLQQPL